jgi:hypothetical protein
MKQGIDGDNIDDDDDGDVWYGDVRYDVVEDDGDDLWWWW